MERNCAAEKRAQMELEHINWKVLRPPPSQFSNGIALGPVRAEAVLILNVVELLLLVVGVESVNRLRADNNQCVEINN